MLALFQAPSTAGLAITLICTVAAILAGAITNYILTTKTTAKWEGAVGARLDGIDERFDRNDENKAAQWIEINKHTADIGRLQGAMKVKANHG